MTTNEQVRHHLACHLFDVHRWLAFAADLAPGRAAAVWASRQHADDWRDLCAWGWLGVRGCG